MIGYRGDNGPGGWIFQTVPDEPGKCLFTWIVNTNLKVGSTWYIL